MRKMIATAITVLGLVGALGTTSFARPAKRVVKKNEATLCPLKGTPNCPLDKRTVIKKATDKNLPPCCVKKVAATTK